MSVKGARDKRTDLQREKLPSPGFWGQCWTVGCQPSSQAPATLSPLKRSYPGLLLPRTGHTHQHATVHLLSHNFDSHCIKHTWPQAIKDRVVGVSRAMLLPSAQNAEVTASHSDQKPPGSSCGKSRKKPSFCARQTCWCYQPLWMPSKHLMSANCPLRDYSQ